MKLKTWKFVLLWFCKSQTSWGLDWQWSKADEPQIANFITLNSIHRRRIDQASEMNIE